ncbi:BnaCnng67250D, partial [Brassica napus]
WLGQSLVVFDVLFLVVGLPSIVFARPGDVSAFIANLTSLQRVKLSKNQLRFDLSKLKLPEGVSSVDLSSNLVTGSLSSLLNSKTSRFLEEAHLSNNQISGRIPDFSECLNVKVLNIGNNKIGGQIPSSISNLFELVRLDISRNHITGVIPQGLGQLEQLNWLDLSINALTGRIPDSLLNIKAMKHVSFRANRLCGLIPQGRPLNIFPASAYLHNFFFLMININNRNTTHNWAPEQGFRLTDEETTILSNRLGLSLRYKKKYAKNSGREKI